MEAVKVFEPTEWCPHTSCLVVRRIMGGNPHFGWQCRVCGKWKPVKKDSISAEVLANVPEFDASIEEKFHRTRQNQRDEERSRESEDWWDRYNEYLISPEWAAKRELALKRDNWLCQACRVNRATQVHHLTYAHLFREPLFELVSVCEDCHKLIHAPPKVML